MIYNKAPNKADFVEVACEQALHLADEVLREQHAKREKLSFSSAPRGFATRFRVLLRVALLTTNGELFRKLLPKRKVNRKYEK